MCAPRDAAEAKRKLDEYRKFNDDFQSRGVLLEQLRQRVYELTANRDSVPGMLDIETQLAQLGTFVTLIINLRISSLMMLFLVTTLKILYVKIYIHKSWMGAVIRFKQRGRSSYKYLYMKTIMRIIS